MVALLRPQSGSVEFRQSGASVIPGHIPGQLRLVVDNTVVDNTGSSSRVTAVAPGSTGVRSSDSFETDIRWIATMALLAAVLVFGGLMAIRLVQGSPVSGPVDASVAAVAAPGDQIVIAQPGDSLWSIAESIAAGNDPRPIVESLIQANGGDSVQIGQQIIIPRQLLD